MCTKKFNGDLKEALNYLCEVDRSASDWANFEYTSNFANVYNGVDDAEYKLNIAEDVTFARS